MWFRAAWLVTNTKNGMSALSLRRALGLRYETAWLMLHKLRRAMVRPGRDELCDEVEVDESFLGGPTAGARGRGTARALIVIAAECRPAGAGGRIRIERIPNAQQQTLEDFCFRNIAFGSTVYTDGHTGYANLGNYGYTHVASVLKGNPSPAHVVMPRVHRVSSLLKRWLLGTHQGGVQRCQLDYYLDEFVFRFNRRNSRSRDSLFLRLLEHASRLRPSKAAGSSAATHENGACRPERVLHLPHHVLHRGVMHTMQRRLTVSLEDELEQAISDAPALLELPRNASDSEKLRAYARLGYRACRESKLDQERLATYRAWADAPEMSEVARSTFKKTARRGVFSD